MIDSILYFVIDNFQWLAIGVTLLVTGVVIMADGIFNEEETEN